MSRPRSSRSSSPATPRAARSAGFAQSPKSDIFVVMLAISLGAMFLGSLLFVLILARYDFKMKVAGLLPSERIQVTAPVLQERITATFQV